MASAAASFTPSTFDSASAFKRRSASIFSRKGTETPVPQLRPLRMQSISISPSISRRWRGLKRKPSEIQKGATILRAVPQETLSPNLAPFNPEDRSIAPSPNTEILNSIGKGPEVQAPAPTPAAPTQASTPPALTPASISSTSLSPRPSARLPPADTSFLLPPTPTSTPSPAPKVLTKSPKSPKEKRKSEVELTHRKSIIQANSNAKVIGVWKDGRAHWDNEPTIPLVAHPSDAFLGLGNSSVTSILPPPPSPPKNQRPRIQVVIPSDQRGRPFASVPFFTQQPTVQPVSQQGAQPGTRAVAAIPQTIPTAPANESFRSAPLAELPSGRSVSPPSVTNTTRPRFSIVSPLTSHSQPQPIRPFTVSHPLSSIEQEPESESDNEQEGSDRDNDADRNQNKVNHKFRPSLSNSSASSNNGDAEDDASNYGSKRSSMTSLGGAEEQDDGPHEMPMKLRSRAGSVTFSIASPVAAGVFDDEHRSLDDIAGSSETPKPKRQQSRGKSRPVTGPLRVKSGIRRQNSASERARQSLTLQHVHEVLSRMDLPQRPSPTLSEAEHELHMQLSAISPKIEEVVFQWDYAEPIPSIPAKSPKRAAAYSPVTERPMVLAASLAPGPLPPRTPTPLSAASSNFEAKLKGLKLTIPVNNRPKPVESKAPTPVVEPEHVIAARAAAVERNITAQAAEMVILRIMENLLTIDDLFSSAIVNKGFYRVFKRHELHLMRTVLKNMSGPAWEHREMSPPYPEGAQPDSSAPKPEYTPASYLQSYMRDTYIIGALKSLILERCQTFLRPETAAALANHDALRSSRVDDAFWRVWTFSKLFGYGKGREEDVVGQMDWLRGGSLFHQKGCRATIMTTESFDVSTVLASAPECFGKGNTGGLTAEQLYDMTELWNCLSVLLQGLQGRTGHARAYGVYEPTNVRGGDVEGEEAMLEEWHYYLLTLGPSTILELAGPVQVASNDPLLFVKAAERGWTNWSPPAHGGSRKTFLKEAVSRVYEEKISSSFSYSPEQMETKEKHRQRMITHIHEIRRRKVSGDYRKITMSMERPMSEWESALNAITSSSSSGVPPVPPMPTVAPLAMMPPTINVASPSAPAPPRKPSIAIPTQSHRRVGSGSSQGSSGRHSTTSRAELPGTIPGAFPPTPPGSVPPPQTRTTSAPVFAAPDLSQHPAFRSRASDQHPIQREIIHSDLAENTADKAIFRIVEMGFTAEQARYALRVTDLGDGLRIDRAVELLLRNA